MNQTFKFQTYYKQKHYHILPKNVRNFCSAKVPYNVSAKNIAVDFVNTVRFNKSSTNDFIKFMML